MDQLNSMESRKVSPVENMQRLEKAMAIADQRIRIRRNVTSQASLLLGFMVALPISFYMIHHTFGANGVM